MLNFSFLENGLGIVSRPHLMNDQEKCLCYILLTDQISLPSRWRLKG